MRRNYIVEAMTFDANDCMVYDDHSIEPPITEEDEKTLVVGQYILAPVTVPNVSVMCKVLEITPDLIRLRRLAQ
jgi:hypothetical protein